MSTKVTNALQRCWKPQVSRTYLSLTSRYCARCSAWPWGCPRPPSVLSTSTTAAFLSSGAHLSWTPCSTILHERVSCNLFGNGGIRLCHCLKVVLNLSLDICYAAALPQTFDVGNGHSYCLSTLGWSAHTQNSCCKSDPCLQYHCQTYQAAQ